MHKQQTCFYFLDSQQCSAVQRAIAMAEAACVMHHAFTFPSYEAKQGNQLEDLQESVSFGRFATESLAWDKWSTFSNKRYVEEAAKHSQPGLVAKKKAFFEAYYKKKAILEQETNNTQELDTEAGNLNTSYPSSETLPSELQAKDAGKNDMEAPEIDKTLPEKPNIQIQAAVKGEVVDATLPELSKMELFTCTEKNEAILRDLKTSQEASEVTVGKILPACPQPPPSLPGASSKRSNSVKGHRVTFAHSTEDVGFRNYETGMFGELPDRDVSSTEGLPASKVPADSLTFAGLMLESSKTAYTETKRTNRLLDSPASRSRKTRADLRLFSESSSKSKSPFISSPFVFSTGKGTDKKSEKLQELPNNKALKKVQFQTKIKDKAASQLKKLRMSFCFSSRPSADLHHQKETLKNQPKVFQNVHPIIDVPAKLEAETSSDTAQKTSMKNRYWKQVEKQRSQRQVRPGSLGEVIAHKGKSPIVQNL